MFNTAFKFNYNFHLPSNKRGKCRKGPKICSFQITPASLVT